MNNNQKIAAIVIRISALTLMFTSIIDIGVVVFGILLIALEIIPRDAFAHEIYFVQGIFFLIGGLILFARSKSLARFIADALEDDEKLTSQN